MEYKLLEPSIASSIGIQTPRFEGGTASLFTSTSFLYMLFFVAIIVVAAFKYTEAGVRRMEASERGIKYSNEIFKKTTLGLLGVFSLWLILSTINKDLLTGNVGLEKLRTSGISAGGGSSVRPTTGGGSGTSRACDDVATVKASLASPSGICANTRCTVLSGCNYQEYLPSIQSESSKAGIDYKMIVVTMCKESRANKNAQNKNENGTYDCGLMQINQPTPCDASILEPQTNIQKGVALMKGKISSSSGSRVYANIPVQAGVFASYNCCANNTVPNNPSESCKESDGWPSIPKWACPIDPRTGKYNMCGVKAYACELTSCLKEL